LCRDHCNAASRTSLQPRFIPAAETQAFIEPLF
jgi:hypothetical protein